MTDSVKKMFVKVLTKENSKYNKQVKSYMQLLVKMGYKNITGYLWYVDEERIVKV